MKHQKRYWDYTKGSKEYRYAWSVRKEQDGNYHSIVEVRNVFTGDSWETVKVVRFGKRWKAKDHAYKQFCLVSGRSFSSLHKAPQTNNLPTREQGVNPFEAEYTCINNSGIEEQFDAGVIYLGWKASKRIATEMLFMEDRFGERQLVSVDRFQKEA